MNVKFMKKMFLCLFMEMMKSHMHFNEHIFVRMNSDTIMKTIVKYVIDMKAILKKNFKQYHSW